MNRQLFSQKSSIVDVCLCSEYASDSRLFFIAKSNAFFYFAFAFSKFISSSLHFETLILIFLRSSCPPASRFYKPLVYCFSCPMNSMSRRSRKKSKKCEQKIEADPWNNIAMADSYKALSIIKISSIAAGRSRV